MVGVGAWHRSCWWVQPDRPTPATTCGSLVCLVRPLPVGTISGPLVWPLRSFFRGGCGDLRFQRRAVPVFFLPFFPPGTLPSGKARPGLAFYVRSHSSGPNVFRFFEQVRVCFIHAFVSSSAPHPTEPYQLQGVQASSFVQRSASKPPWSETTINDKCLVAMLPKCWLHSWLVLPVHSFLNSLSSRRAGWQRCSAALQVDSACSWFPFLQVESGTSLVYGVIPWAGRRDPSCFVQLYIVLRHLPLISGVPR